MAAPPKMGSDSLPFQVEKLLLRAIKRGRMFHGFRQFFKQKELLFQPRLLPCANLFLDRA
jgi:hypothetical protein